MSVDDQRQRRFVDNLRFHLREVESTLDVGLIEFQPPDSVGINAARIRLHKNPRSNVRLLVGISQLFQDPLGVG